MDGSHEEVDRIGTPPQRQMHSAEAGQAISIYQEAISELKLQNADPVILYTLMHERMIACLTVVSQKHLHLIINSQYSPRPRFFGETMKNTV